jgi:hypothetical protein
MEASNRLVEEILPKYGFTQTDIEATSKLIRNSFNQRYETLADRILHDSMHDYLGRVDYMKLTEKLLRERTEYGHHSDAKTWEIIQNKLLSEHEFLTKTARLLRSVSKEEQITELNTKK